MILRPWPIVFLVLAALLAIFADPNNPGPYLIAAGVALLAALLTAIRDVPPSDLSEDNRRRLRRELERRTPPE